MSELNNISKTGCQQTWTRADRWIQVHDRSLRWNTAYVVSFKDFIGQVKPANYNQLERLLSKDNCTQDFSPTKLSEIEAELAAKQHLEFEFPTVRPLDLNNFFASSWNEGLKVYWIR